MRNIISLLILFVGLLPCSINAQTKAECKAIIAEGLKAAAKQDYTKALELYEKAHVIAIENQWPDHLFWIKNNTGIAYCSIMEYGEALNYFLDAYKIAVKSSSPEYEMKVLNNISLVYTKDKNYEKAKEFILKACDIAIKEKDTAVLGPIYINLANNSNFRNAPLEAKAYMQRSRKYVSDEHLSDISQMILSESELLLGNYGKARMIAENVYQASRDLKRDDIGLELKRITAKSYLKEGNFSESENVLLEMIGKRPNVDLRRSVFELLIETYEKQGRFQDVSKYKDSILRVEREIFDLKSGRQFEHNKVKFEIQNYKNEIAAKQEKLASERKIYYALLFVCGAMLIIIFLVFRQKNLVAQRNKQKIELELEKEKNANLILERQISERENSALLEKEYLKNEIEARNRKLSAKALYLSGRNELIEEILSSILKMPKLVKDPILSNNVRALKEHMKADNDWDSFMAHFEEVNTGFLTRLKTLHPSLSANDIRFLAYIYMNLSTKEIATMLNITPGACAKRKERVISKMELPEDSNLYNYLSSL